MSTINLQLALRVMRIIHGGRDDSGPIAAHFMNKAFPGTVKHPTQRTRLFLHRLREAGLVEGHAGRDGQCRWWSLTDAGRQFLSVHR